MASYHLYMVANGETSVESQDHEQYRRVARDRGEVRSSLVEPFLRQQLTSHHILVQSFVNSYDLGYRRNLKLFFNVGPDG